MDNASYYLKLLGTVTRIARHSYYPGKEEAIDLCLEEIGELHDCGRITDDQLVSLRELLLGEEGFGLIDEAPRKQAPPVRTPDQDRIAIVCQGTGSQAAFTAGVLEGLLEQVGRAGEIVALAGTSFGALCALLVWDGLVQGGPRQAVAELDGFWGDYAAATVFDALLNYSSQMVLHLRTMVPLPVLGLHEVTAVGPDQLRRMLERQIDFATVRTVAARPGSPGLVIGSADVHGVAEVCLGPAVSAEAMQVAAGILAQGPATILEARVGVESPDLPRSPIHEVTRFKPSEIWLIEVKKRHRQRPSSLATQSLDLIDMANQQILEQELRFIEKINALLKRGVLVGGGYRPIEVHRIVMEHDFDETSKLDRGASFICQLMSYGRDRAAQFLEKRAQRLAIPSASALHARS